MVSATRSRWGQHDLLFEISTWRYWRDPALWAVKRLKTSSFPFSGAKRLI